MSEERPAVTRQELAMDEVLRRANLTDVLNRFPEVEWDRWAVQGGFGSVFGWIDRTEEAELWVTTAQTRRAALDLAELLEARDDNEDVARAARCIHDLCAALEGLPLRRDFIVLELVDGEPAGFTTSSARLSMEFNRRLGLEESGHMPCRRIEGDLPGVERAVRL